MACLSLMDRILPAFADKGYVICVFLDYSACFDTLSRQILVDKLSRHGLSDAPLELIRSYLSTRKQCVKYKDVKSEIFNQNIGVIQGSRLGPLLFDVYANDINNLCHHKENIMFADDTCLTYFDSDLDRLTNHVNNRLRVILDWCNFNQLSLNSSKTEFMLFTNRIVQNSPSISIGSDQISRKSTVKYLGLHFNENLNFSTHIDHLKKKLSQLKGISYRLNKYFYFQTAKNCYLACVYSQSPTVCLSLAALCQRTGVAC